MVAYNVLKVRGASSLLTS